MLDLTVRVSAVTQEGKDRLRLLLDCGNEHTGVELIAAFNFADETLLVQETGEP
jgi:hypothetical protein